MFYEMVGNSLLIVDEIFRQIRLCKKDLLLDRNVPSFGYLLSGLNV